MENIPTNNEALKLELKEKLTRVFKEDMDAVSDKISEFVNGKPEEGIDGLKQKYPDYVECELYHLLTFSGMIREPKFFDFPGDDSVERFIRNL